MAKLQLNRRRFLKLSTYVALGSICLPGFGITNKQIKVTLLGDSIRVGYQGLVSLYLVEDAEIWVPEKTSMNTIDILNKAYLWIKDRAAHILHINVGLEDIKCIPFHSHNNLIPLEQYVANIERIIKYIHHYQPDTIIIWATTTPVIDSRVRSFYEGSEEFIIYHEDIIRYNEACRKVMERLGVPVNDLYEFAMAGEPDQIMLDDGIHFTETGYELLGEQVADAIRIFLNK